jgi:hypothetical protein
MSRVYHREVAGRPVYDSCFVCFKFLLWEKGWEVESIAFANRYQKTARFRVVFIVYFPKCSRIYNPNATTSAKNVPVRM